MEGEKSDSSDFVLTRKETAARLRNSLRTLTCIERAKKLTPRIQLSDRRYRISAVENYLSARTA